MALQAVARIIEAYFGASFNGDSKQLASCLWLLGIMMNYFCLLTSLNVNIVISHYIASICLKVLMAGVPYHTTSIVASPYL